MNIEKREPTQSEEAKVEQKIELGEIPEGFQGQDAEVSVMRSAKVGKPARLEGGWEVLGLGKEAGTVLVVNRKQKIGGKVAAKEVPLETLKTWQPFKKNEKVPISAAAEGLVVVSDGWKILDGDGNGGYTIFKFEGGQMISRNVKKAYLVQGQIAKLEEEIAGNENETEKLILQEMVKYWKSKLETIENLRKKSEEAAE